MYITCMYIHIPYYSQVEQDYQPNQDMQQIVGSCTIRYNL